MSDITETNELLEKKCPRCGKASANSSNPSGRCSACLKKLATAKKTPGHWQRAQTKADDALRRQKGKNGTAHKKSSGLGSRDSIVKQTQSAEKKTGQKLSPDRKNNSKGYAASNTRMVPEKLNRGRHHVDEKKLRNWKKRLKKSEIDTASLYSLMKAKFHDDPNALELIKSLGVEGLEQYIELFDIELFEKSAAPKLEPASEPAQPSIHNEIGKTHTVEIHPDMDHLYRAKGLIKENNRPHLNIIHFKQAGFPDDIVKKIPRDAQGKVTPEMIDKHIASLPKQKVNVTIHPYAWGAQQHRKGPQYAAIVSMHPEEQMKMTPEQKAIWGEVASSAHNLVPKSAEPVNNQIGWSRIDAHSKPDHWHLDEIQSDFQNVDKVSNPIKQSFNNKIGNRDNFIRDGESKDLMRYVEQFTHEGKGGHFNQMESTEERERDPKFKEIREAHLKNLKDRTGKFENELYDVARKHGIVKPREEYEKEHDQLKEKMDATLKEAQSIPNILSHNHEDPQHAIHSAINALGRKLGVKSMSMDTLVDQAKQSGLRFETGAPPTDDGDDFNQAADDHYDEWMSDNLHNYMDTPNSQLLNNDNHINRLVDVANNNPNFSTAIEKLGGLDHFKEFIRQHHYPGNYFDDTINTAIDKGSDSPITTEFNKLSTPEKDVINDLLISHDMAVEEDARDAASEHYPGFPGLGQQDEEPRENISDEERLKSKHKKIASQVPIHQLDTYHKRPSKLGMKLVPKSQILGEHEGDRASHVQYMNLHKKITYILETLKKAKK